ncbi:MAG TPA: diacylglycerol kinase family protein [Caulobacteraceae bacterium]|jgi:diacylglycerol kinase family enzyme|nr:diacylglycerol kinase family protein [Caulobacteraceae bacterium]
MTAAPVLSFPPDLPRPRIRKVAAVINPLSHSVGPAAVATLTETVAGFGLPLHLASPEPEGLGVAIQGALDAGPDLLVVLAGDGTAREAARLCGPDGPLLAVLPGGTMNVLSHALYGLGPWPEILKGLLETGVEQMQSGGKVGGRPFYVAAVLGSPALWAPVREAVRAMRLPTAWKRGRSALSQAFAGRLRFEADGRPRRKTTGLGLICPMISRVLPNDTQALEAALLDQRDIAEVLRLGGFHLLGDWRADPKVATLQCVHGEVWARRPIPAILDGESFRLERLVSIEFVPRAYRALAPGPQ